MHGASERILSCRVKSDGYADCERSARSKLFRRGVPLRRSTTIAVSERSRGNPRWNISRSRVPSVRDENKLENERRRMTRGCYNDRTKDTPNATTKAHARESLTRHDELTSGIEYRRKISQTGGRFPLISLSLSLSLAVDSTRRRSAPR